MKRIRILTVALMAALILTAGCNVNYKQMFSRDKKAEEKLFRAEIHFGENEKVVGYIKSLGVQEDAKVYVGGASLNYLYDQQGNIVGSYNYMRVEYINILPEEQR
ncbi:MAG: hypothetical protein ABRQ26_06490 [Syntrophomonadaceae bacterium]